jgi:hypothetical protein
VRLRPSGSWSCAHEPRNDRFFFALVANHRSMIGPDGF